MAAIVIVLSVAAAPLYSDPSPQIVLPGIYHAGEVAVEDGSTWLAVVPRSEGFVIQEAKVSVEVVQDPIVDNEGETTGLKVSAPSCFRTPLFLVRGIHSIKTGWIGRGYRSPKRLGINEPFPIRFPADRRYSLGVYCGPDVPATVDNFVECPLVFSEGYRYQALKTFTIYAPPGEDLSFASEGVPLILWAGDIDRDGTLDLLLDLSNHYNVSIPTLFLSSAAGEGELVAEVASFFRTGC